MRHYCEAEEVVVYDMRDPVTAREALKEGELREALKRLSNVVDADVLLERNLLACRSKQQLYHRPVPLLCRP